MLAYAIHLEIYLYRSVTEVKFFAK